MQTPVLVSAPSQSRPIRASDPDEFPTTRHE